MLIIWEKGVTYNMNFEMTKIINEVNFLEQYILITRNKLLTSIYPTNMQIECKFFVALQLFLLILSEIIIIRKGKKIAIIQIFCGRFSHNFTEMMPG